ncbi:unnamed protein product [Ambrosiozyma monospora]|uniref:Unnamed protein product n=1 Tax=Ambrosiozyma monospora TaxID=43982 RepID=A0ACB5T1R2_AMBMO|nr:unnamed protein product [Ambrosiozyma monospora]
MESILNFNEPLNITVLDSVVDTFYKGSGEDQAKAQKILTSFQDHPEAWTRADVILTTSTNPQSKYIALSVLDNLIKTKWKLLPQDQRLGIRNFLANMIIAMCQDESQFTSERALISKLNLTLVEVIKQDWPANWPNFIPELCASSHSDFNICENNMSILKLLAEEIFDFSAEQMTQAKAKSLKDRMVNEFTAIFQLCFQVLDKATKPSLIIATLQALLRYIPWIPYGYIFETTLLDFLAGKFLPIEEFRSVTIKCLTEISQLIAPQYDATFVQMFGVAVQNIENVIPLDLDLKKTYRFANSSDQEFLQDLAMFLSTFLTNHLAPVEQSRELLPLLLDAHKYLVGLSRIEERELFKTCLDYWFRLVSGLYQEIQTLPLQGSPLMQLQMGSRVESRDD